MLGNLSIRAKISLVPAAVGAALVVLGLYAVLLLGGNEVRVRALSQGVLTHSLTAQAFAEQTERSLWRIYRLTSVAANESDEKKVTALAKAVLADTEAYAGKFAGLKQVLAASGMGTDKVEAFEATFAAYIKAAKATIDMAETDAGTSLIFIGKAQRQFDELAQRLDEVQTQLNASRDGQLAAIDADMAQGRMIFAAATVVTLVIAVVLALVIGRRVAAPIAEMAVAVDGIANKRYDAAIPALGQRDELGRMAKAVDVLKQHSMTADRLAEEQQRTHALEAKRRAAIEVAVAEFDSAAGIVVAGVSDAATELTQSAQAMSGVADGVARQAQSVTTAAEETSANVQTVASASEQLSSSIVEIGRQAASSAAVAGRAVEEAARTDAKMQGLDQAAQKIGDVLKLIGAIAGQTNLLALNATIEAARAGDAGKGFAVVASEVKSLATQTAKATEEIAAQIGAMQAATRDSVASIQGIGKTITEINEIATAIAAAVEQQGSATQEIARNIQEAARGTQLVSATIGDVQQSSTEAGSAAAQVRGAAGELSQQSETLRAQVDAFLAKVRVA